MPNDKLHALPPRPTIHWNRDFPGESRSLIEHMDAQDARIAELEQEIREAITQRDEARNQRDNLLHYSQLCPEHLSNAYRRHMPAAEGRCASCLLTRATSKRFKAEAALAELKTVCQQQTMDELSVVLPAKYERQYLHRVRGYYNKWIWKILYRIPDKDYLGNSWDTDVVVGYEVIEFSGEDAKQLSLAMYEAMLRECV